MDKRMNSIKIRSREKQKLRKEFRTDYIYFSLYLLCLGVLLWSFLIKGNSNVERIRAFIEMCRILGQVSVTVVIGYVALFVGLAAIYPKNDEESTLKQIAASIRIAVYFCISSLLMLVFLFLPMEPQLIWALQEGVFPVFLLFLLNQIVFIILNHHALKFIRRIIKKL